MLEHRRKNIDEEWIEKWRNEHNISKEKFWRLVRILIVTEDDLRNYV